jgi:membrane-associated phospholipid phosphatase
MSWGLKRFSAVGPFGNYRLVTLLDVAMYEATVAAWDSKYAYNWPRPKQTDPTLATAVATPASPSYPSEHAVVAGAAAIVLAYLMP